MEISHGIETNSLPDKKLQLNDNVELMGLKVLKYTNGNLLAECRICCLNLSVHLIMQGNNKMFASSLMQIQAHLRQLLNLG